MKKITQLIVHASLLGAFLLPSHSSLATGANVDFSSLVSTVEATGVDEGTVTVTLHGIEVSVATNGDTEIKSGGEEIALEEISAGDFVKIEAFFSDEGIVADEIEVLDNFGEHFRFRGTVQGVSTVDDIITLTVMGIDISVSENTRITRRQSGRGNRVPATELQPGDEVNILGSLKDSVLFADRIHVGSRAQGDIEIDGTVLELSETSILVSIDGGGTATIIMDVDTKVSGVPVIGSFVEVEGRLGEDLTILAFEIVVDEDGDGDADDDNPRVKRDKDRGQGNGIGKDRGFEGSEILLLSETAAIRGKTEFKYEEDDGEVEQEFELKIENGDADTTFSVIVFFTDTEVDFGAITTDDSGRAKMEFESDEDNESDGNLNDLLPEGLDVRDITAIQIVLDGTIILEGSF